MPLERFCGNFGFDIARFRSTDDSVLETCIDATKFDTADPSIIAEIERVEEVLCQRAKSTSGNVYLTTNDETFFRRHDERRPRIYRKAAAVFIPEGDHHETQKNGFLVAFSESAVNIPRADLFAAAKNVRDSLIRASLSASASSTMAIAGVRAPDRMVSAGTSSAGSGSPRSSPREFPDIESIASSSRPTSALAVAPEPILREAFRVDLRARRRRVEWLTGLDVAEMVALHRMYSGPNVQVFGAMFRNRRAVIKSMHPTRLRRGAVPAEFLIEMEMLSRLSHPNIVCGYGCGTEPLPFIVMEPLQPMKESLNLEGPLHSTFTFRMVVRLAKDLARALHYLHEEVFEDAMIIHRDLKPDNMGIDPLGNLKLFDFGLGQCVRKRTTSNETYVMSGHTGTMRFMAPEVALRKPYTEKVDVYSYGIFLWCAVTNSLPFQHFERGDYTLDLFRERVVVGGERPPLSASWNPTFQALLKDCWHADYERRPSFRTILTVLDQLSAWDWGGGSVSSGNTTRASNGSSSGSVGSASIMSGTGSRASRSSSSSSSAATSNSAQSSVLPPCRDPAAGNNTIPQPHHTASIMSLINW